MLQYSYDLYIEFNLFMLENTISVWSRRKVKKNFFVETKFEKYQVLEHF